MKLKNNGVEDRTAKIVGFYLGHLSANVDLEKPESVEEFIASKDVNNDSTGNLVKAYNYSVLVNNVVWERPKYKWEQNKPRIPSETALNSISSCAVIALTLAPKASSNTLLANRSETHSA